MKRREFLKKSALLLGAITVSKEGLAHEIHKNHEMPAMHDAQMHTPSDWSAPDIKLSPLHH